MAAETNITSLSRRTALAGGAPLVGALASLPAAASLSSVAGIDQALQDVQARYEALDETVYAA